MRTIYVSEPDTSEVRVGTLWHTDAGYFVLVLTKMTEDVYNIIAWEDTTTFEQGQPSMILDQVLALSGQCIAYPLPNLVQRIEQVAAELGI